MEGNTKKAVRCGSITARQKEMLVAFMEKHPQLKTRKFSNIFTHKDARNLWSEVTVVLNQCPNGSKKEWEQWRKVTNFIILVIIMSLTKYIFIKFRYGRT